MPTTVVHTSLQVQRQRRARYLPFFFAVLSIILITAGRGDAASVLVAPSLTASQTQQFTATVTGTGNAGVTWSLSPAVGTISGTGLYIAPAAIASAQNVTVKATSTADPTQSASSILSLIPVTILLTPSTTSLTASQTQQFTTTVSGTANTGVTWSVSPALGTISSSGIYTAPAAIASAQNVTVKATSTADPTKSASATVTLNPPVNVTVAPASVTLTQSQTQTFSATVTNTGNTAVTWSLSPVVGSITAAGLYTAPASIISSQTVTVKATSVADPTKSATATVTLTPPVTVSLTPSSVSLLPSQNQTFTATVSGTSNTAVTWSINPPLGGLVSSATTAVYVAPSTAPTTQSVTITTTSMADPSKTATAVITLLQAVTLSLNPSTVSLAPSGAQQFTAMVLGTSNTAVTWSINPSVGTISSAGLYAAPSSVLTPQTITVSAQNAADPTKSASATISLSPPTGTFTYYVDSANGSDSNLGTQALPWQTLSKVNALVCGRGVGQLGPGMSVGLKRAGTWRETLMPPCSGTVGSPITFGAYGSGANPIITGSDLVTAGWARQATNVWRAPVSRKPNIVYINGTRGTPVGSIGSAKAEFNWYWESGFLYTWSPPDSDPSIYYIAPGIEAGARDRAAHTNDHTYLTFTGLTFRDGNATPASGNATFQVGYSNIDGLIVDNCVIERGDNAGMELEADTLAGSAIIRNSIFRNNGADALLITGAHSPLAYLLVSGNQFYGNTWRSTTDDIYYSTLVGNFGTGEIVGNILSDSASASTCKGGASGGHCQGIYSLVTTLVANIHDNTVFNQNSGGGIKVMGSANIYDNRVYNNSGYGIYIEGGTTNLAVSVYRNLVYLNNRNAGPFACVTEALNSTGAMSLSIQQNTCYQNSNTNNSEIDIGDNLSSLLIKNNIIFTTPTRRAINFEVPQSAATVDYNLEWRQDGSPNNIISSTVYAWLAWKAHGFENHGINADPLFTDPAAGDFSLRAGSLAINTGAYIPGVSIGNSANIGAPISH